MRKYAPTLLAGLVMLLGAGCRTTITNLTPSQAQRTTSGMYPFSAAWDSSQQSVAKDTIKAYVMVGNDLYTMQRTPLVRERWETVVPVPADKDIITYQYKFEYQYYSIPQRKANSMLSKTYQMRILEK